MSAYLPTVRVRGHGVVLAWHPIPIMVSKGSLVPVGMLAAVFVLYSSGADTLLLLGAAALGGLGGAASLIVHELGHVRAARRMRGIKAVQVSLVWLGAGTKFEGAYRSGRDQATVAIAGPVASVAFAVLLLLSALMPLPRPLQYGLFGLALLNIAIAVVSLVPVYPLDGHKVLMGLLWRVSGSERRARTIVRRLGKTWLAIEGLGCLALTVERPTLGCWVFAVGAAIYLQQRITTRHTRTADQLGSGLTRG